MVKIQAIVQVPERGCQERPGIVCRWFREMKFYKKPKKEGDLDYRYEFSCWLFQQPVDDLMTPCERCQKARNNKELARKTRMKL